MILVYWLFLLIFHDNSSFLSSFEMGIKNIKQIMTCKLEIPFIVSGFCKRNPFYENGTYTFAIHLW